MVKARVLLADGLAFDSAAAKQQALVVATRNTKDFDNITGLVLASPWQTPSPH
jgi:hypothetical protein